MDARAIPGGRDVRATLDGDAGAESVVVACPPHPQLGGSRSDQRLTAVSDALTDGGIACLRFDYGPWTGGDGERHDAANAVRWARDHFDRVGLFGYSFGAGVAVLAASEVDPQPGAVSILAPPSDIGDWDVTAALADLSCRVQVLYGERDDTVDWEPVASRARELDFDVTSLPADHHFVGQSGRVGGTVATFFDTRL